MKDRVPTYPGRVKLTPVSGQTNVYDMTMADSPIEAGTPPTKANLLTDETATLLGLTGNPTVNDALQALKNKHSATGSYVGTGTYGSANLNSLTFDFIPKLLIVRKSYTNASYLDTGGEPYILIALYGMNYVRTTHPFGESTGQGYSVVTGWGTKTIKWYGAKYSGATTPNQYAQFNDSGYTYRYVAFD